MHGAMGEAGQMCREFAVCFAAAACAVLLALPTTMLGSAVDDRGQQTDAAFSAPSPSANYELMTASLHWQAKLALADLQHRTLQ